MATFSSVTRQHVLQAIAEYDERGGDNFLETYGFAPARGYELLHEGRTYDLRAVVGVAHRFATGRQATPEDFSGGLDAAVAILRKREFDVTEPPTASRSRRTIAPRSGASRAERTPRPTASRASSREIEPTICPTCSMALPATGICDSCG